MPYAKPSTRPRPSSRSPSGARPSFALGAGRTGTFRAIHRVSAVLLGAFLVAHIANHVVALAGVDTHRAVMDAARTVYRWPPIEAALLGSVLAQAATGLTLAWRGRRRPGVWSRIQLVSGVYLAFFLVAHVSAILFIRHGLALDTNFHAAAMVLTVAPLPWFYAPYYAAGVIAVFAHMACALRPRLRGATRARVPAAVMVAGAAAAFAVMGSHA